MQKMTLQRKSGKMADMDKLRRVCTVKNEDLEARSSSNNLPILGVPESTDIGRMEDYVEKLVVSVFRAKAF